MNQQMASRYIRYLLIFGLGMSSIIAGAALAAEQPWHNAEATVRLGIFPESPGNVPRPAHSLALSAQQGPAVLWSAPAAETAQRLLLGTETSAGVWQTRTLVSSAQSVWAPDLVYAGPDLVAVWLEGDRATSQGQLVQMDVTSGYTTTLMSVYGFAAPEIAVAPTGFHMVYTSANPWETLDKGNLYYAHRAAGDEALLWTFGLLVGRNQVIAGADSIWWPRIALNAAGTQAHLVWQQDLEAGAVETNQVWYMSGDWNEDARQIVWGTPMRITAGGHQRMVEPRVAVDPVDDSVYLVWVQWLVGIKEQYVYLCRWNGADCEVLHKLNEQPVEVSQGAPLWAYPAVTARDGMVCVGWHDRDRAFHKEEVFVRCSRDRGETWQGTFNISADTNYYSVYSDLHLDAQQQLHVTWLQLYLETSDPWPEGVYYRRGAAVFEQIFLPLVVRRY